MYLQILYTPTYLYISTYMNKCILAYMCIRRGVYKYVDIDECDYTTSVQVK